MSFRFKNAPAHFQKSIENILKEGLYIFVVVYIDDIIIFSKELNEHFQHLTWVLTQLHKANLKCVTSKVHLFLKQVKALGFIINHKGITTSKATVEDLLNFPTLKNKQGVRRFLGLAGVFEKFIINFRTDAEPLYALLRKENEFFWGERHQLLFNKIKEKLTNAPVLIHF